MLLNSSGLIMTALMNLTNLTEIKEGLISLEKIAAGDIAG